MPSLQQQEQQQQQQQQQRPTIGLPRRQKAAHSRDSLVDGEKMQLSPSSDGGAAESDTWTTPREPPGWGASSPPPVDHGGTSSLRKGGSKRWSQHMAAESLASDRIDRLKGGGSSDRQRGRAELEYAATTDPEAPQQQTLQAQRQQQLSGHSAARDTAHSRRPSQPHSPRLPPRSPQLQPLSRSSGQSEPLSPLASMQLAEGGGGGAGGGAGGAAAAAAAGGAQQQRQLEEQVVRFRAVQQRVETLRGTCALELRELRELSAAATREVREVREQRRQVRQAVGKLDDTVKQMRRTWQHEHRTLTRMKVLTCGVSVFY